MYGIEKWYCCLNPEERAILATCADAYVTTLGVGIPCDIFDLFWVVVLRSREGRKAAFGEIFFLEETQLEMGDPVELVCLWTFTNISFWIEAVTFVLSPASLCLGGCDRWYPP